MIMIDNTELVISWNVTTQPQALINKPLWE